MFTGGIPHTIYSVWLFLAAGLSLLVMHLAWTRRESVQCAYPVAVFSFGNAVWSSMYALHWSKIARPGEFFWVDMTYFGVVIVPTAFFVFALCYTDRGHWITKRRLILLSIEPLLTLFFLWTDPRWGLFFAGKRHSLDAVIFDGGMWFWFHVIYSYSLVLVGVVALLRGFFRQPRAYRGQVGTILTGAMIPWGANVVSILGHNPTPNLDLTPIAFTLTGIFISLGVFRYRFLDLRPIAHDVLFANLNEAVIVLDARNRIIEVNSLAKGLFLDSPKCLIGQEITAIRTYFPEIPQQLFDLNQGEAEFCIGDSERRYFEIEVSPLVDRSKEIRGRILTLRDVTARKQVELQLLAAKSQLEARLDEIGILQQKLREEAIRDHLTGLFNRRYLQETLERELSRALREGQSVSVVMIDLDDFKQVNDRYGHSAGDQVLIGLSKMLMKLTRREDIVCRFGGEELVVVMPGAPLERAARRADSWRKSYQAVEIAIGGQTIPVTLSAGVACAPQDALNAVDLLLVADRRLYAAKAAGKNQVCQQGGNTVTEPASLLEYSSVRPK